MLFAFAEAGIGYENKNWNKRLWSYRKISI